MSAREVLRYHAIFVSELEEAHVGREFYIFTKENNRSPVFRLEGMTHSAEAEDWRRDCDGVRVGFQFQSGRSSHMDLADDKEVFVYLPIIDLPDFIPAPVSDGWL